MIHRVAEILLVARVRRRAVGDAERKGREGVHEISHCALSRSAAIAAVRGKKNTDNYDVETAESERCASIFRGIKSKEKTTMGIYIRRETFFLSERDGATPAVYYTAADT